MYTNDVQQKKILKIAIVILFPILSAMFLRNIVWIDLQFVKLRQK